MKQSSVSADRRWFTQQSQLPEIPEHPRDAYRPDSDQGTHTADQSVSGARSPSGASGRGRAVGHHRAAAAGSMGVTSSRSPGVGPARIDGVSDRSITRYHSPLGNRVKVIGLGIIMHSEKNSTERRSSLCKSCVAIS